MPSDDRRQAPRTEVFSTATVLARHNNGVEVVIENLSMSGARVSGPLSLAIGERVQILFEIDSHPIEVIAEVVRVTRQDLSTDHVAVRFVDVPGPVRERIRDLVLSMLSFEEDTLSDGEATDAPP